MNSIDRSFRVALLAALICLATRADAASDQSPWGYSLSFDGLDDRVDVPALALNYRSFSVEFWAKRTALGAFDLALFQGTPANNNGLHIGFRDNNAFTFAFYGNDLDTPAYADDAWHHWACTYDGPSRSRRIYRDGVVVAQGTASADYRGFGPITIGSNPALWSLLRFRGSLADVRIWNVTRSQAEIQANILHQLSGTEAGLLGCWKFDEGTGVVAHDATTNHLDGTLVAGPSWVVSLPPQAPVIIFEPVGQFVPAGGSATLRVGCLGASPLCYQWHKSVVGDQWTVISGATNATLLVQDMQSDQCGLYRVVISNASGSVTSEAAGLGISRPLVELGQVWSYNQFGMDLGTTWRDVGFDDWGWPQGAGALGAETNPAVTKLLRTILSLSNPTGQKVTTYYFRTRFTFDGDPATVSLVASNLVDDGAVAYLNGTELYRLGMPEGTISASTFANRAVEGSAEGAFEMLTRTNQVPLQGENALAVEIHQSDATSPDVVFGLSLQAVSGPMVIFRQPVSQTVYPGDTAAFSVQVAGSPPWDYQWQFNGADLAGQTNATLTLTNVRLFQGGRYRVLLGNAYGTLSSSEAVLGVKPVVAWGGNSYGQTNVPVYVTGPVAVAAGREYSLALRADGTVVGWGLNVSGQATGVPTTSDPYSSSGVVTLAGQTLTNVVAIAAGSLHSLALRADGTVVAWGSNSSGQTNVPAGLTNVAAIAAGYGHNLALRADGTVFGWGANSYGQATGVRSTLSSSGLVMLAGEALTDVVAVAAGRDYSLALRADGTVVGWGFNSAGQATGVPDPASPGGLVVLAGETLTNVVAIAAGNMYSLALRADGTVVDWGVSYATNVPAGLTDVVAIAAGNAHSLALRADGTVAAWGEYSSRANTNVPAGLADVVAIAAGSSHSLALVGDGSPRVELDPVQRSVFSGSSIRFHATATGTPPLSFQWQHDGSALNGATNLLLTLTNLQPDDAGVYSVVVTDGLGQTASTEAQLTVLHDRPVMQLAPVSQTAWWGGQAVFSVVADGVPPLSFQWRFNGADIPGATESVLRLDPVTESQVGDYSVVVTDRFGAVESPAARLSVTRVAAWGSNTYGQASLPADLSLSEGEVVAIAAGYSHSLALRADGTVVAWGSNSLGQTNVPAGLSEVVAIAAGCAHSLALRADGTVVAWGSNSLGQTNVPAGLGSVVAITAGHYHSLALRADGAVVGWGYNSEGQTDVPIGLTDVVAIAAGGGHSLALRADGTVVGWGYNVLGQATGVPTTSDPYSSSGVVTLAGQTLTNVVAIAAGESHSLALRADGTVVAWGSLSYGLADLPPGLHSAVAIAAWGFNSLALRADGTVVAWGSNSSGQTNVPVGLIDVAAIAAGGYHSLALRAGPRPWILDQPWLAWQTTGDTAWFPQSVTTHDGVDAAQSGVLTDGQQSRLSVTVIGPGTLSFWWKVSSEAGADELQFLIDGVVQASHSGEVDWQRQDFSLGPGRHTVEWVYAKNGSGSAGQDAAWVDEVRLERTMAASIDVQPVSQWGASGGSVTLSVSCGGRPLPSYQWQRNGVDIPGATNASLTFTSFQLDQCGFYRVVVSNAVGTVTSETASLGIAWPLIDLAQVWSYDQSGADLGTAWREVGFDDTGWPQGPGALAVEDNWEVPSYVRTALSLTNSLGQPITTYYFRTRFTFDGDPATVSLVVSNLVDDGAIVYLNGTELYRLGMPEGVVNAATYASRDVEGDAEGRFETSAPDTTRLLPGENTLAVEVHRSSYWDWDVVFGLSLQAVGGPTFILRQPASQTVFLGGTVVLSVEAVGSRPLSYQWQLEGTDLVGETNAVLTLSDVQPSQSGRYQVMIRNGYGTVSISEAALWVGPVAAWGENSGGQTDVPAGLTDVLAVAAGWGHSLALRAGGTVVAWGYNDSGQINVPTGLTNVVAIAAGAGHSLALRANGTVVAWGYNDSGQTTVPAGLGNVVAVAAGWGHSLALRANGTVVAWGNDYLGQATVPAGLGNVVAIAAGYYHSLALKSDGTVVTWGSLRSVPAGLTDVVAIAAGWNQSLALRADGTVVAWGVETTVPAGLTDVVAIAANGYRSLALKADGTVVTGDGSGQTDVPTGLKNVVAIAAGYDHSLALVSPVRSELARALDGAFLSWQTTGDAGWFTQSTTTHDGVEAAQSGVLGDGRQSRLRTTVIGPGALAFWWKVSSAAGADELQFLVDGVVQASVSGEVDWQLRNCSLGPGRHTLEWVYTKNGSGSSGQDAGWLDQVYWGPSLVPAIVSEPVSQAVPPGGSVTLSVGCQGALPFLYQWQRNGVDLPGATEATLTLTGFDSSDWGVYRVVVSNAFGTVTSADASLGTPEAGPPRLMRQPDSQTVVPGDSARFAVTVSGSLPLSYQWEKSVAGGPWSVVRDATNSSLIIPASAPTDAGDYRCVVSNVYGTVVSTPATLGVVPSVVVAWASQTAVPAGLTNIVAIAAGSVHNLALKADGTVVGWGTGPASVVPAGLNNVVAIAAGFEPGNPQDPGHSLALKSNGTVVAWGSGSASLVPAGLNNVVAIATGANHSLALKADGTVVTWGMTQLWLDVQPGLKNVVAIAAGEYQSLALKADGTVVAWGFLVGLPAGLSNVVAIAAGGFNSLALRADGTVADGPAGLSNVVAIAAGVEYSLALKADGTVVAWGANDSGQTNVPAGLDHVVGIAAGFAHSLALLRDGSPRLTVQPFSQTVLAGTTATLQVMALGDAPLSYQWYRVISDQWSVIGGATNSILRFESIAVTDAGDYRCVVSNALGTVTSRIARLKLESPPVVEPPPESTSAALGSSVTLNVVVQGTAPFRYQWRLNGVNIPGATNATYTISSVQLSDGGSYRVVVGNVLGVTTSDPTLLVIAVPQVPAGDNFDQRVPLTGGTFSIGGTNQWATRELGEPFHAGKFGSNSVWYAWTAPASGIVTLRTVGSTFDTLLGVYVGSSLAELVPVAQDEDRGGYVTSQLQFNAVQGVEYQIAIDGFAGQQGSFILSGQLEPTVEALPVVVTAPQSQTVREGSSTTFQVVASGQGLTYQWSRNGLPIPGATTDTLSLPNVQAPDVGFYTVAITNALGRGLETEPVALEIGPEAAVHSQDKVEDTFGLVAGGGGVSLSGPSRQGADAPMIQVAAGDVDHHILDNRLGTTSAQENHCGVICNATRWLVFKPNYSGTLVLDTLGSEIDTVLAVYTPTNALLQMQLMGGAVSAPGQHRSRELVAVESGRQYWVVVDGVELARGQIVLNWALGRAPEVSGSWTNALVSPGGSVTLSVGASGALPAAVCQWYRGEELIAGATNQTLVLSNLQASGEGAYRVVVSNAIEEVEYWAGVVELWPKLRMRLTGGSAGVVLEWPADAAGYQLEVSESLEGALWIPVPDLAPERAGDWKRITLDVPATSLFFRLRNP